MKTIIAGKTILLNTKTNCTFLANELDEEVQTGTRGNDSHIEWAGELSIPIPKNKLEPINLKEGNDEDFVKELTSLINRYSKGNGSNTPDYILSEYLFGCLKTWNSSVMKRSEWYGFVDKI